MSDKRLFMFARACVAAYRVSLMSNKEDPAVTLQRFIEEENDSGVKSFLTTLGHRAADVCSKDVPRMGTALHLAAKFGNVSIISLLLDTGMFVDVRQNEALVITGMTPLHLASGYGHFEAAKCLLDKGADPNAVDSDGQPTLLMACKTGETRLAELLLTRGANVNTRDNKGQTALLTSILRAPTETSIILIEKGADILVVDQDGQSPLHYATEWGDLDVVQKLVKMGAIVNLQDHQGNSPLHLATDEKVRDFLLENGGDPDIRNLRGVPPIEKKIDTESDEIQNINRALSKHLEKTNHRPIRVDDASAAKIAAKFAPKPGDPNMADLKASLMGELLKKQGGGEESDLEPHNTQNAPRFVPRPPDMHQADLRKSLMGELQRKNEPKD